MSDDKLINPYVVDGTAGQSPESKVYADISTIDKDFIKSIHLKQSTNSGVIGHLWKKLVNECKRRNILDVSKRDEFIELVVNCHIVGDDEYKRLAGGLRDGAAGGTLSSGTTPKRGEHPPTGDGDKANAPVTPDIQGRSRGKGKGTKGTGKA